MGLAAAIPLIGSAIETVGSIFGQSSANQTNKELAELSYQRQRELFDYQNAYNSPKAQMERYKEAGLNPNLIYGQQNVTSVQSPVYRPPEQKSVVPNNMQLREATAQALALGLQLKKQKADIDQVEAQTEYTRQKTKTEGLVQTLQAVTGDIKTLEKNQMTALQPYQLDITKTQAENVKQQLQNTIQDLRNKKQDELLKKLDAMYKQGQVSQQQIDKEIKEADLLFKRNQNELRSMGVNDGDNILMRILVRALNDNGILPNNYDLGLKK